MSFEKNWWVYPGFKIKHVTSGLKLPVNIAFVNNPGKNDNDPLFYVTELYGQVKVITRDYCVHTYAEKLLNYKGSGEFPGSGESGLTGICVEPESGDLFLSMLYKEGKDFKGKVVRTMSSSDKLKMRDSKIIIDDIPSTTRAHQIQAVTIGPDKKLYVNIADGGDWTKSQNENDLRGKVLRLSQSGKIPWDNPDPSSPIYAKGFRNPFGAVWRKSDRSLYIAGNGPDNDDRIARVKPYENYGWPATMRKNSIFWWHYCQAPTAIDFMQNASFPPEYGGQLFVALFGAAYQKGTSEKGKKIVKLQLNDDTTSVKSYDHFVVYKGKEAASPCGLAFGPDGLYFSDLHGEKQGQGNIYKVVPDWDQLKEMREKTERYDKIWP
jgi:glucose/arabinose dehydrogenase